MENTNTNPAPNMNQIAALLTACANKFVPSLKAKVQLDSIIAFGTTLGFDMGLLSEYRQDILTKEGALKAEGKIKHTGSGAKATATLNILAAIKEMDIDADTLKTVKNQFSKVAKLLALMNDASYKHGIKFDDSAE